MHIPAATAALPGITLTYEDPGPGGEPVLLVMGRGATRAAWGLHQVPALIGAGYRAVTFDNRGVPPNEDPPGGITIEAMAQDTAALIDHLGIGPCRIVGFSMGVRVVAELLLKRPELATQAVLMAGSARADVFGTAIARAERDLYDADIALPRTFRAMVSALQYLSPTTLRDQRAVRDWLDIFTMAPPLMGPGERAQFAMDYPDRRTAYAGITTPLLCLGFTDDVLIPAEATREIADLVPGARYTEIADCGHFGYLERPREVNEAIIRFFDEGPPDGM